MEKNHQDKTEGNLIAPENTLPPVSSKDQKKLDRVREDRNKAKHPLLVVAMSAALAGVIVLIYFWFKFSWPLWVLILLMLIGIPFLIFLIQALYTAQWTGFKDKKLWDWLNLLGVLAVPLILGLATLLFTAQQAQSSLDQQRADTLQKYVDNIQDLLLNHNLLKSSSLDPTNPYYDVEILARARTLTALQGLDPGRKVLLVQFLYDARLIGFCVNCPNDATSPVVDPAIIDPSGANLSGIHLSGNFSGANLSDNTHNCGADLCGGDLCGVAFCGADLSEADLSGANLWEANLSGANLSGANLSGTILWGALMSGTNFSGANLSGARLSGTNLSNARNLTQQQLDLVATCAGATLPQGLTCHQNVPGG